MKLICYLLSFLIFSFGFLTPAFAAKELAFEKLSSAITTGNLEQLKQLLKEKKNLDEPIIEDETLLMHATSEGQFEVVKWLFKNRVNPNVATKDGHRALSFAILGGHSEIARWLLKQGAEANFNHDNARLNPLFDAITVNDLATVKVLTAKYPEMLKSEARDSGSPRLYSPLQWAQRYEQDEIATHIAEVLASKKRLK